MPSLADSAAAVAHAFAEAISRRNLGELLALMTDDHAMIDSLGNRLAGRDRLKAGWEGYFRMVPDYAITVEETFSQGPVVLLFGTAHGTYAVGGALLTENRWTTPAAWRVLVRDGRVAEWRVYADNEPIRQIIARGQKPR